MADQMKPSPATPVRSLGHEGATRPNILPELDLHRIQTFAEERVPARARHQVRLELDVNGSIVTLYELRAPWDPKYGPAWTRSAVASLRY